MIAIVAINNLGVIGDQGRIPWASNAQDMRHFVALTNDAFRIIVGRKTWESLPSKAQERLARRQVRVLTNGETPPQVGGVRFCDLEWVKGYTQTQTAIIGGAQAYAALKDLITTWHVTTLDNNIEGDTTLEPYWRDRETFGIFKTRQIQGGVIRTYRRWM